MNRFILVAFFFMGLAYYEMSGGADFVPEARADPAQIAAAEAAQDAPTRQLFVAKATAAPAQGLAAVDDFVSPSVTAISAPILIEDSEPVAGLATASSADPEPVAEYWTVTANRLNVREGPSTGNGVIGQVSLGEEVAIVSEDAGDGWVMIRLEGDGIEGWVASRFLTR